MIGRLNEAQVAILKPYIKGQTVYDLGAGSYIGMVPVLLETGAKTVVAVDKAACEVPLPPWVYYIHSTFSNLSKVKIPVAFVSWPIQHAGDLAEVLEKADTVIYLGKNTDGTICGHETVWHHLTYRPILAISEDRANTLIVYGPTMQTQRHWQDLALEERGGLDRINLYPYQESAR